MPFGFPQCVFAGEAVASQHDAKVYNFSFCEHGLKKAALTQVARKHKSKRLCSILSHLNQTKFQTKTILFLRLPLVVTTGKR